jgi:uncharacterized protein (TIGR02452 family)
MTDPVCMPDGHTYERSAIARWLSGHPESPVTRQPMAMADARPNYAIKSAIDEYNAQHPAPRAPPGPAPSPAGERRRSLKQVAEETMQIIRQGSYTAPSGRQVDISSSVSRCSDKTVLYRPDFQFKIPPPNRPNRIRIEVRDESTVACCERLYELVGRSGDAIAVLNFANAVNLGEEFLKGAAVQEADLQRSSALYASLSRQTEYYEYGRSHNTPLFSDHLIYSPSVPIFRRDDGTLLEQPVFVSVISSAAPCATGLSPDIVRKALKRRIMRVVACAIEHGHSVLVLGAYGCGVRKNDPVAVAGIQREILLEGKLGEHFRQIVNPIPTHGSWRTFDLFQQVFAVEKTFLPNNPFEGIFSFLTRRSGGNVSELQIVAITASGTYKEYSPKNVVDFDKQSCYNSRDMQDSWISFDFQNMIVTPTHYSIMSGFYDRAANLRNWVIEGSMDGDQWVVLDDRRDNTDLNGTNKGRTFQMATVSKVRIVRLRQTGRGHHPGFPRVFVISAFELFGTLIEQ